MLRKLNSPVLYLICGAIILFVAIVCVIALVRAWRAGIKIGMDKRKLKRAVTASITFSILPSAGILLGVIALSGSLGIPWPWLRLSVIGALHYETQVAEAASEAVGIGALSAANMTPRAFATIALLAKIQRKGSGKKKDSGFGDLAMTAMFIGLVSAYIGSYIGKFVSEKGILTFSGSATPLLVSLVSAAVMSVFTWLIEKKRMVWLESFSIAGSMLIGMLAAILM